MGNYSSNVPATGVVWITGAGSGIGAALARRFAQEGFPVALSARTEGAITALAAEIAAAGGQAQAFALDVHDRRANRPLAGRHCGAVQQCRAEQSAPALAGHRPCRMRRGDRHQPVRRDQRDRGDAACHARGRRRGDDPHRQPGRNPPYAGGGGAYGASKHALVSLSASLDAAEGRNGIRSTALCSGEVVATPLLLRRPGFEPDLMYRMIQPDDVAKLALTVVRMNPAVAIHEIVFAPVQRDSK